MLRNKKMRIKNGSLKLIMLSFIFYILPNCYIAGVKGDIIGDIYVSEEKEYRLKLPWRGWVSEYMSDDMWKEDLMIKNQEKDGEILVMSPEIREIYKDLTPEAYAMAELFELEEEGILTKIEKFEDLEVAGYPAKKINFEGPLKKGTLIIFKRDNKMYLFRFIISYKYFYEQEPIFYDVVKSFTFLK
jgi:hypothetical protein